MSPVMVRYHGRILWQSVGTNNQNRPFCQITVHGAGPSGQNLWSLLDTGADYLMLDSDIAVNLGLSLVNCPPVEITGISGSSIPMPKATVDVTIHGKRIRVDAVFGIKGFPLVGRSAIVRAMDFGIDLKGWVYKRA